MRSCLHQLKAGVLAQFEVMGDLVRDDKGPLAGAGHGQAHRVGGLECLQDRRPAVGQR